MAKHADTADRKLSASSAAAGSAGNPEPARESSDEATELDEPQRHGLGDSTDPAVPHCRSRIRSVTAAGFVIVKAAASSVTAATEDTIALLSYHPETVEKDLTSARDRLTGSFRDDYTKLTTDVVIPGSTEKKISAVATVPAAASVSASENHAVALVFVDQATTIGTDAPTDTASTVRLTLEKVDDRWLISQFDPV
jgi:hypothetical protein